MSKSKEQKAKILTIGDSFSEQGNIGYKNYLAEKYNILHVDRFISNNQIGTLNGLVNGDFFDKYNVEYVLLENVERFFVSNAENVDVSKKLKMMQVDSIISNHTKPIERKNDNNFFSKKTLSFPFSIGRYLFRKNYLSNNIVYNVELKTDKLFSNNSNKLLFLNQDVINLKENNSFDKVRKLNYVLNEIADKLKKKNIKLIVLPAPDKYDLYYQYIAHKTYFPKPLFFDHLNLLKKRYFYIDSKKILSESMESEKDIYYFGDTHWTPIASKIISKEIDKVIRENE